jgi:hypothetical protein
MGAELLPLSVRQWGSWLLLSAALGAAGCLVAWRSRRQGDETMLTFALATAGFALLTLTSGKFAEYFVPLATCTMALASRRLAWKYLPQTLFLVALGYTLLAGRQAIATLGALQDNVPAALTRVMRDKIPPGAHIFTTEWDRTGRFMLELPDRYFMVALDPTFFSARDPELYRLWRQLITEGLPAPAATIRSRFGSNFLLGSYEPSRYPLLYSLEAEPGVRLLYVDQNWVLFDLGK